ncbi:hypothetical protein C1645_765873 [Glomus cerebriforme]|uniref:BTB domain-containing protein n=1 Tax=Glomus cerebriforme TaxID=658196 RepID=A0A397T7D1_9GLOM|nr:hypothetical protein C1645_765873 [Glomus cerebriforme]
MATVRRTSTIPMYNTTSIMPPEPVPIVDQNKVTMCFQYTFSGIFNNNKSIFSPPFSTHVNNFWQLKFTPMCSEYPDYCSLALFWVRNPEEQKSGGLSNERLHITKACLFVKDKSGQLVEKKSVSIRSFRNRWPGQGWGNFVQRAFLSERVTFGVEFETIPIEQDEITLIPNEGYPDILKVAWEEQLEFPTGSDVQFNISGHTLYASSIVLSNRSEYFKNMFQGDWCEVSKSIDSGSSTTEVIEEVTPEDILFSHDLKPILPISSPKDSSTTSPPPKTFIKYKVDVSDCDLEIFKYMLIFLYTDQTPFTDINGRDQLNFAIEMFSIADKYLIGDLRHRAMQIIWESLTDDKAAEVLFTVAINWPDLKECVLDYVVSRFGFIRKTDTFKKIKSNQSNYPGAGEVFAELLLKLVPDS